MNTNNYFYNDMIELKKLSIEKSKVSVQTAIPEHLLKDASILKFYDTLSNDIIYRFEAFLASTDEEHTSTETKVVNTTKVPETWWDHVKERFAPKWFLNKFPINYTTIYTLQENNVIVKIKKICPHINLPADDRSHYEFLFYDTKPKG